MVVVWQGNGAFATKPWPEHLVRPTNGANLLTGRQSEAQRAQDLYGFTDNRGVVAKVAGDLGAGLVPVWRLYRAGDFVWATDGADADGFVADGYQRQFVAFHASSTAQSCLGALHRLERDGVHRVATASETVALVHDGWVDGGASFFVAPAEPAVVDTTFSIAVIPDTQDETSSSTGMRFANRVSWLVDNKAALDLRYAVHIGDLTSWGHVAPAQFQKASTEIKPLEAVIPWSVAAGNHDTAAVCARGSACPEVDAGVTVRNVLTFNSHFPPSRFGSLRGTYAPNASENSYATFSAGGSQWLVLTLELWPRPGVVTWASGIVAANPTRNVIINTHSYLEADGSIRTSNGGYGSTSPEYLFDNLVTKHANIKMVMSGHRGQAAVRLVEIDTAADTVTSSIYAPESNTSCPQYSTSTSGMDFR